jgi:hypothetical protein
MLLSPNGTLDTYDGITSVLVERETEGARVNAYREAFANKARKPRR